MTPAKLITLWRKRLFGTPFNGALTIAILLVLAWILPPLFRWAIFDATFLGDSREACTASGNSGACWVFVKVRFLQFMFGLYPETERWRPELVFLVAAVAMVPFFSRLRTSLKYSFAASLIVLYPLFAFLMLYGGFWGLSPVDTAQWGGLMLTLIISGAGIVGSLPLGIMLALGRRSRLPFIRSVSVAFIELWRGVPLITVLFMAAVMFPLFLPRDIHVDKLARALIGTTLFASAYMAETVRAGLQAIPAGQAEAAAALGLSASQANRLVILPQALRLVIPGIVNTFIGLVKDTSLVLIIGMFDLLGMVQAAATDPKWLGMAIEGYVFAGACFWVICYSLSVYSQRLETRLKGAKF